MGLGEHRAKCFSLKASQPTCNRRVCGHAAADAGEWRQHGVVGVVLVAMPIVGSSWVLCLIAWSVLSGRQRFPEVRVPSKVRDNIAKTKMMQEHELYR